VEVEVSSEQQTFAIQERSSTAGRRLLLRGAMRPTDASLLQSAFARICDGRRTRIVLDLRELTSIDSAGMHCLIAAYETAREHGHELEITPGPRIEDVHQLIDVLAELPLLTPPRGQRAALSAIAPRAS
jgi:anti-anti-sigma factor